MFHFFPQYCSGGFIGVDVFFVISGFLITEIIAKNIHGDTFSFSDFYLRRVKRLFPALILVFSTVLVWGWFYLIDFEFVQLGKHLLGGIFFVYNFVAEKESGYFGGDAGLKLIHHIWSLAVEEQFYLFYPVYLIVAKKLKISFMTAITFLIVVTFLLNIGQIYHVPNKVFYHPEYRMWELAFGGLVATFQLKRPRLLLSMIALIAIIAACFYLSSASLFPGYWALLPVTGTSAIIAFSRYTPLEKLFSLSWLTWIGRISYPLYLWHWPLFAMTNYYGVGSRPAIAGSMLALSFVLAGLTYELVEKPVKKFSTIGVSKVCLSMMGVIAILAGLVYERIIPTMHSSETSKISAAMPQYDPPPADMKFNGYPVNFIAGRGELAKQKVLLLGDSLAYQYYPRFEALIPNLASSRSFYELARGACPPIPGLHKIGDGYCGYIDSIQDFVKQQHFEIVAISARWDEYLSNETLYRFKGSKDAKQSTELARKALVEMIKGFQAAGSKVILIESTPSDRRLDPRSMIQRDVSGLRVVSENLPLQTLLETQKFGRLALQQASLETGTECLNPLVVVCTNEICPSRAANGRPLYKDDVHFTPQTAAELTYLDFLVSKEPGDVALNLRCR